MPLPKIAEVRQLSEQELSDEIVAIKRQLFELRMKRATSQPFKPSDFKHKKHRLAQLLTVEHERVLGINQTVKQEE
jgi:large subunit ribosomal protein L29